MLISVTPTGISFHFFFFFQFFPVLCIYQICWSITNLANQTSLVCLDYKVFFWGGSVQAKTDIKLVFVFNLYDCLSIYVVRYVITLVISKSSQILVLSIKSLLACLLPEPFFAKPFWICLYSENITVWSKTLLVIISIYWLPFV